MNVQVHCLVENGAVLERADNSSRVSERATGCQNPALVASLLKKGSKMGMNLFFCLNFSRPAVKATSKKKGFETCRFIWVQWFTNSLKEQMIPGLISGGDTKKCLIRVQSKWCAKYNCQAHMQPCIIRRFIMWKVKLHKYCLNYTKVIMW